MEITASILYVYVQFPHCVTMDRFAPPGEEEPVSAFVQLFSYPLTATYHRFLRRRAKTAKAHKPIASKYGVQLVFINEPPHDGRGDTCRFHPQKEIEAAIWNIVNNLFHRI